MNNIDYKSDYWLYDQYWNKGKSSRQMAVMCGITFTTILGWMKKFNIARRKNSEPTKEMNEKMSELLSDDKNPRWKGGKPNYYRRKGRKVFEEYYDYSIPSGLDVHHRDGNYKNNIIENLVLLTHAHHTKVHRRWER